MAKKELSKYQQSVISGYYQNRQSLMLQKISELVTELYLAETKTKQDKLWQRVQKAMENLKVNPAVMEHIMKTRSAEVLAKNLQDWLAKK